MTKLDALFDAGQSVWFDFIRRSIITSGKLQHLVEQGVKGVTSNPAIFEKAIAGSTDYDADLKRLSKTDRSIKQIYEALALEDIRMAADVLASVYDLTQSHDGYVSLEVSPDLAHDTEKTIQEAIRLYETVSRPNVMIKVPATPAGIPAITELISRGVNVNVTLIFGLQNYKAVADAYLAGLEMLAQNGPALKGGHAIDQVASVASFFVSRVDTAVDKALAELDNSDLQGKIAIANAKVAYEEFNRMLRTSRWQQLSHKGAKVQRVLWASTGTKNPAYSDTLYVDELIGPNTVNTLPPATLESFLDHGRISETLRQGLGQAHQQLEKLEKLGIDLNAVTRQLQDDGVVAFAEPFEALLKSISEKREKLLAA
jgi:transaldolase